jgi:hypothetical protein
MDMAVTRIKNNQITDASNGNTQLGVNAAVKLQNYTVTSTKIANNLVYGSDLTVTGNLTVQGNTTTIDTTITTIEDPVIVLASTQTSGAPTVDIGYLGYRGNESNIAFVWDESAAEFVTVFTSSAATNTVVTITSYANFHTNDANIGGNIVINGTTSLVGNLASANVTGNITSGNVLTSGVVSAAGTVTGGNLATGGTVSATGNVTGANILTGGLISSSGSATVGNLSTSGTVSAAGTATVGNLSTSGTVSATGNITGNYFIGNGSQLTGVTASSVDANNLTGNTLANGVIFSSLTTVGDLSSLSVVGTATTGNLATGGTASATGNVTGGNILTAGIVSATGNVTGNYFIGNGALLTGIDTTLIRNGNSNVQVYANSNVAVTVAGVANTVVFTTTGIDVAGTASATGTITGGNLATAGTASATGTITGGNIATAGTVSATGTITGGNVTTAGQLGAGTASITGTATTGNLSTTGTVSATGNVTGGNIATAGVVSATGNITGNYFFGNGSQLTGIDATLISNGNSNVQVYANGNVATTVAGTANVVVVTSSGQLVTGTVSATGTVTGGNVDTAGTVSAAGNVTGGNVLTSGLISAAGTITSATTITGGNISTAGTVSATGNINGGNINTAGTASATGTVTGGNLVTGGTLSATGTATVGNLATAGTVSATGNAQLGNVLTVGLISSTGTISSAANITGANILTGGQVSATGNVTADNVNTDTVYSSGALTLTAASGDLVLTPSGNINASNNYINNVPDPVQAQDAATKEYVDNAVSAGLTIHAPVLVESPTALNATYAQGGNTFTVNQTIAGNTVVFTTVANLQPNDQLWFTNSFEGILGNTAYFVVSTPNTSAAVLSLTYSGAPVANITSNTGLTQSVRVNSGIGATLTNAGANATLVVDGVTLANTNRVLVYQQANAIQNGVYVVSEAGNATTAWQLTRSNDMNTYAPDDIDGMDAGDYFYVTSGDTGAGESYVMTDPVGPFVIGYANLTFTQFSASQVYTANTSAGLSLTGTVFSAKVDNNTTAFDGGGNIIVKASANLTTPNIGAATGSSLSLTGTATMGNVATAGTISGTGNITGGNVLTSGLISSTGNITGNYFIGNGSQLTGVAASSVDANNLIGNTLSSNVLFSSLTAVGDLSSLSVVGTATTGNLATGGTVSATGNVTGGNVNTAGTGTFGNVTTAGTVSATGTVTGGNIATGGTVSATGNATLGNVNTNQLSLSGNVISALNVTGNIAGGNLTTGNVYAENILNTAGNTQIGMGNGSGIVTVTSAGNTTQFLPGGQVSLGGAARVQGGTFTGSYLTLGTSQTDLAQDRGGNVTVQLGTGGTIANTWTFAQSGAFLAPGAISATGNITGGNILSSGSGSFTGNVTAANFIGNISGNIDAGGANTNIQFNDGDILAGSPGFTFDKVGNVVTANGNITGANISTAGVVTATGNVQGGNISTAGLISATGTITSATTITGGNIATGGTVSATGTATAGNLSTGGTVSATGTITGGNIATGGTASATGNITGGNILTAGVVSATGNITGNYFFGNGSQLTGIDATSIQNGNSNVRVLANSNVTVGVAGTSNVTVFADTGIYVTGLASATGNVQGGNIRTAGLISATGNITGGNLILTTGIVDGPAAGRITINGSDIDTDFAVDGDTVANVFYVDAGTGTASFGSSSQTVNAIVAFNATTSILTPVGNVGQRPSVGVTGMLRFNTTNNALEIYDNSQWTSVGVPVFTVIADQQFNGDGSTVAFTLSTSQTTNSCIVSINGVVQIPTLAYSVSTTTLTFTEAPLSGDVIDVRQITTTTTVVGISNSPGNASISVSDTSNVIAITGQLQGAGNALTIIGDLTITGNATVSGNVATNQINNGTSAVQIPSLNGNVNIDVGAVDNMTVFTSTGMFVTGNITATGDVTAQNVNSLSDATLKTNVTPIENAGAVVDALEGKGYDWKDGSGHSYGMIAQAVEEIIPEAVKTDATGIKSVNYQMVTPFLIETIKELRRDVAELKKLIQK